MAIVLFDTNILIDHFNNVEEATNELLAYDDAVISAITWIELACKFNDTDKQAFAALLAAAGIRVVHTNDNIMYRAAEIRGGSIRKKPKIHLPDCIILATAAVQGRVIVTRNPKDYGGGDSGVHVPYKLENGIVSELVPPRA